MEWISVDEKLPDDEDEVLIFIGDKIGGVFQRVRIGYYLEGICWDCMEAGLWDFDVVTHWMPLPDPPPTHKGE